MFAAYPTAHAPSPIRNVEFAVTRFLRHFLACAALAGLAAPPAYAQASASEPGLAVEQAASPSRADTSPRLTADDASAWLDGLIPRALAAADIAGAVVVVVKDGEVLAKKGYGYADLERGVPVDPDRTLFHPGSISKLYTWTAVMQLVEQGELDLDADINAYLDFKVPSKGEPITLRHVMTHTTGLANVAKDLIVTDLALMRPLGDAVKASLPEQVYAPGTTPSYSNYATALAGYIVERVSGQSFDDYIEQHIFAPLGMRRASFRQPLPPALAPDMSQRYASVSKPAEPLEWVPFAPAGSMAISGTDMARFAIAHLREGAYGDARILRAETARAMHAPQHNFAPPLNTMGLGFIENQVNGRRVIGHSGGTASFISHLHLFMDDDVALYMSLNGKGRNGGSASIEMHQALFEAFADRYFPAAPDSPPTVDSETAAEHARLLAGSYETTMGLTGLLRAAGVLGQVRVLATEDGILVPSLTGAGGQPLRWREVQPFLWQAIGGKERLAAVVEDGKVVRWSLDSRVPMTQVPVGPWRDAALWMPLLLAGLAVLLATVAAWPFVAAVRRHYRGVPALTARGRWAYRAVRIAALAMLLLFAGWMGVLQFVAEITHNTRNLDGTVMSMYVLTLLVCLGALAASGWNLYAAWADRRPWWSRLWAVLLVAAVLVAVRMAALMGFLSFQTHY